MLLHGIGLTCGEKVAVNPKFQVILVLCILLFDIVLVLGCLCQTMNFTPPSVPYWFQTPKGSDIDLRLLNRGQLLDSRIFK